MSAGHDHHQHHHGAVHLDEAHWQAWADDTELAGEVLLGFVTSTAAWITDLRGPDAPPVRRVVDIGSGPGVGTCELARSFPGAHVTAVDSSPAMLERTTRRIAGLGLEGRVDTHVAELPGGLDGLDGRGQVDLIWSSMALHHVGDEVAALRAMGDLLGPGGLMAIAERDEPLRFLADLDLGRPGLIERLVQMDDDWFAAMRAGLAGSAPSADLAAMITAAGLEVVATRQAREQLDPPLSDTARRYVLSQLRRTREHLDDRFDDTDKHALEVLCDPDDPRSVLHRPDVFLTATRLIAIARRPN